jgi:hypothetical protein
MLLPMTVVVSYDRGGLAGPVFADPTKFVGPDVSEDASGKLAADKG